MKHNLHLISILVLLMCYSQFQFLETQNVMSVSLAVSVVIVNKILKVLSQSVHKQ